MGAPGQFHDPKIHNRLNFFHPDSQRVNYDQATKFKAWMQTDKDLFTLSRPSYPMYYDRDMLF